VTDSALIVAELDEATICLSEVTVALATLYPILAVLPSPPEARGFIEDGMDAAGRARRQLDAVRLMLTDTPAPESRRA
jgi:hypothetical protein